jgi:hypothetical protein
MMNASRPRLRLHFKFPAVFILLWITWLAQAQVPEYTQRITRSFKVSSTATVDISNKYGKLQVMTWDNDSVKFIIELRIKAKDKQKLQKLKQNIDFEFTTGQSFVIAHTVLGQNSQDIFKEIVDIAGTYLSTANSVTINYTVMVPAYTPLMIENKFGNVYIDNLDNNLNLTLSYGDLTAGRLNGKTDIRLSSGDGAIGYMKDGQVYVSYGDLHVKEAGRLYAETRSSNVTIEKSATLKLDSRRDKLFLNDLGSVSGSGYFSAINIGDLHHDANLSMRYGNFTVDKIYRTFSQVNLTSDYTDLALGFERPPSFTMELTRHQDMTFTYPAGNLANLSNRVISTENKQVMTSGTFGTGNAGSAVIIKAPRKCRITLSYR